MALTLLTQVILFIQILVSAIFGWHYGVRKGAIASLITFIVISIIALLYSGLWVIFIAVMLPFLFIGSWLGLVAGKKFREGKKLIAIALISPLVVYWACMSVIEIKKQHELQLVVDFVKLNKEVIQVAGGDMIIGKPSGGWTRPKNPFPFKYELFIGVTDGPNKSKGFYSIVDVSRSWWGGSPTFSLACVTSLPPSARDPRVDVCKQ